MSASIWDAAPAPLQKCGTPQKLKFPTRQDALNKVARLVADKPLYPYRCPGGCGWWHLSSQASPKDTRRNRPAIDLGITAA